MCVAPLLKSRCLVSRSYFCLYLSWMAGSYEIITFLCVPWSCVRQVSRLPHQQWAWAAEYADTLHTSSRTQNFHKELHPELPTHIHAQTASFLLFILRVCPPWQPMEMQSKLWVFRSMCVCVSEVMWHFWADMKRHSAPSRLEGAPGERHWWRPGVSRGEFHDVNKRQPVKHKLESPHYLLNAFLNVAAAEDMVHKFICKIIIYYYSKIK